MFDSYNRRINYLRISVTDRCNLRCQYCMPEEGIRQMSHEEILSYEEIRDIVGLAVRHGIDKVRITGGEPLVRKGVSSLIGMLAVLPGIKDLSLTTNGIILGKYAIQLREAGLHRVNVSLDTLDPARYRQMTRGGEVGDVLAGIRAAVKAGLHPVKINCVVRENREEPDAMAIKVFCDSEGLQVRFISQMKLESGRFGIVDGGDGGKCHACNRLRLTADGKLKPCLFSDLAFDVKTLGPEEALRRAVGLKPEKGTLNRTGEFYNIGG